MTIGRQDGWTPDEDMLLAEVVLRHMREGSTQLKGFEEVGKRLTRTSAACGFRWNSFVRKQYQEAIESAKKKRRMGASKVTRLKCVETVAPSSREELSLERSIAYLQELKLKLESFPIQKVQSLAKENEFLHARVESLIHERDDYKKQLDEVAEDYQMLVKVFDKVRRLAVDETEEEQKIKFHMDQNGNLERI